MDEIDNLIGRVIAAYGERRRQMSMSVAYCEQTLQEKFRSPEVRQIVLGAITKYADYLPDRADLEVRVRAKFAKEGKAMPGFGAWAVAAEIEMMAKDGIEEYMTSNGLAHFGKDAASVFELMATLIPLDFELAEKRDRGQLLSDSH